MYCNKKFIVLSLIYMFTKEDMKSEDYIYSLHYSLILQLFMGGQKMKWVNLSNAIAYIENNLDGEISFDTAARIACCSTNYVQRMSNIRYRTTHKWVKLYIELYCIYHSNNIQKTKMFIVY